MGPFPRMVQHHCTAGHIPGAQKPGKSWAIPPTREKPQGAQSAPQTGGDRRCSGARCTDASDEHPLPAGNVRGCGTGHGSRPPAGHCLGGVLLLHQPAGESGAGGGAYITSPDLGARLSACLIYAYANLSLKQIQHARFALNEMQEFLSAGAETAPHLRAAGAFIAATSAVLLHLPLPRSLPSAKEFLPLLPPGLRAFALYVQAHHLYLKKNYTQSIGVAEATLSMGAASYPIPAIYLHLIAVMDYMRLKKTDLAQDHLLAAWEIARPDDLIEGFGEHHGLMGAMLEAVIKPRWPEDFKRIIDITNHFSKGWRDIHNPDTGQQVADNLTTTEFVVAMLMVQDWTCEEIASHMGVSASTVRRHQAQIKKKLQVKNRHELMEYMLP